jgi:CMP/dCMP kinase
MAAANHCEIKVQRELETMTEDLKLRDLLADLAGSGCDFVVIGSSALAMHGWEVAPTDLDLLTVPESIAPIKSSLRVGDDEGDWVQDGQARRLECTTDRGPVDLYLEVSGPLAYESVTRDSVTILLGEDELNVKVGSLEHVRDMRAAIGRDSVPPDAVLPVEKRGAPKVVAIDGPAGAGKSTVTRAVAREIGFTYLDTGAMYRCVTLAVLTARADTDDSVAIKRIADDAEIRFQGERVFLDGRDVSDEIRLSHVTEATPHIAAYPEVRAAMVKRQRQLFTEGGYVAEGRDTGTVVAPDAPLKIYLTASLEERALRRSRETGEPLDRVMAAMEERDRLDSGRELSALKVAEDAVVVDTSGRSVQDVVDEIAALARERGIL